MESAHFDVFKGKTVLVTGHTGFKGSWLSLWLQKLGASIIGYALDPEDEKGIYIQAKIGDGLSDYRHDIRDYKKLLSVIEKHEPEFVFHLAAQAIVRESFAIPKDTLDINVGGTINILEACRLSPSVKALVVVTSDKCYENTGEGKAFCENDRLGGFDPYSVSKACAELVATAYGHSFFNGKKEGCPQMGLASVRAGNVIGGGDWAKDRVVPDCIRALRVGQPIKIRNPHHTRPWQHVLEPLAGYLLLASKMFRDPQKYAGAWNFGPKMSAVVPVSELVDRVIHAYGQGSWNAENTAGDPPKESHTLALDTTKAIDKLKWRPLLDLDEAVTITVDWYKNSAKNGDICKLSMDQIDRYISRIDY